MASWQIDVIWIALTIFLVILNGFFVAAEFALVKLRPSQLVALKRAKTPFAGTAEWLMHRLDRALSCCQLGITMASLALGWVGEPAIARLLHPLFEAIHVTNETVIHTLSFIIAFTLITAAHLVIGEQAPKIFAIRRPEKMALWCALPLKWFYIGSYPLLLALNASTGFLLKFVGIEGVSEHDSPHSEEEIRALLSQAHVHGELTRSEHKLLNAVFEFDDTVCRQIMVPRVEVEWIDVGASYGDVVEYARSHRHTRYPVCEGSMDQVLGFLHTKELIGIDSANFDLRTIIRPPRYVPETIPISSLLAHFRGTCQHIAFVIDEYGAVAGIVTLENVVERIVGPVQDEFDLEPPKIVPDGAGRFLVLGSARIAAVNRALDITLTSGSGADTMSGLLMERLGRVAAVGDRIELEGVTADVVDLRHTLPDRIRLTLPGQESPGSASSG
ncbi:MAG: HlyC/CorC family transporter [Phycisphaerales bacterium]|nr:hemolysin family protein [Phycisphaerae bacterium]NNM26552.1 HlyC/CorC family transporter [Phycisphaerales bacterium]